MRFGETLLPDLTIRTEVAFLRGTGRWHQWGGSGGVGSSILSLFIRPLAPPTQHTIQVQAVYLL